MAGTHATTPVFHFPFLWQLFGTRLFSSFLLFMAIIWYQTVFIFLFMANIWYQTISLSLFMAINLLLSQFTLLLSQYGHDWVLHYFHFRFPMNLLVTAYFHFPYFNGKESIISYNLFSGLLSLSLDIGNFYASLFSQLWQC